MGSFMSLDRANYRLHFEVQFYCKDIGKMIDICKVHSLFYDFKFLKFLFFYIQFFYISFLR